MFNSFSTSVQMTALTLDALVRATGLEWIKVDLKLPQLPTAPGVYVWVDAVYPQPLWYHGSGSGKGGLRARLSNQLRWRAGQLARTTSDLSTLSEQKAYDLAREVPAVQQAAMGHDLYYAIAKPAPWSVERNTILPPEGALEWEAFISALSLLVTGHRGLIGGGAWESKSGTIGQLMTDLAWDRLIDLQRGSWQ